MHCHRAQSRDSHRDSGTLIALFFGLLTCVCCENTSAPEESADGGSGTADSATSQDALPTDTSGRPDAAQADSPAVDAAGNDLAPGHDAARPDAPGQDCCVPDSGSTSADAGIEAIAADLFVAPNGQGEQCSLAHPCDLFTAKEQVRGRLATMDRDVVVLLRGGTYHLTQPFVLRPEDSGQNGFGVWYRAFPGEEPVLSGGLPLASWQVLPGTTHTHFVGVDPDLTIRHLYIGGHRAQRARGEYQPDGFTVTATGYQTSGTTMAGWSNPGDIEFVDHKNWKSFRCKVATISGNNVTMSQPCWGLSQYHSIVPMDQPTWVENAYELLDQPGEWYHDRSQNRVLYIPREGEDLAALSAFASGLETLMELTGDSGNPIRQVGIEGITFAHNTWLRPSTDQGYPVLQSAQVLTGDPGNPSLQQIPGAVIMRFAQGVLFRNNTLKHLGSTGIELQAGCKSNHFFGNTFYDISGSGIQLGDIRNPHPAESNVLRHNKVANNVFSYIGQEYHDGVAIFLGYAADTLVEHNLIHHVPYTSIAIGWGWTTNASVAANNVIRNNISSYGMLRLFDGGHIYALSTQAGTSITGNVMLNQVSEYGAVYLDQGCQHYNVAGNVISSAPHWTIVQPTVEPYAANNSFANNYADTSEMLCCNDQGCCTDRNTFSNNTTFDPGQWPLPARDVVAAAGLQTEFTGNYPDTIVVEAEAYNHGGATVGYLDMSFWGNSGEVYRDDNVDIYFCSTCSNDFAVGSIQTNEWLRYNIFVPATGVYDFGFRASKSGGLASVELSLDQQVVGTVDIVDSGANTTFVENTLANIDVQSGVHMVTLKFSGSFMLDHFAYTRQ